MLCWGRCTSELQRPVGWTQHAHTVASHWTLTSLCWTVTYSIFSDGKPTFQWLLSPQSLVFNIYNLFCIVMDIQVCGVLFQCDVHQNEFFWVPVDSFPLNFRLKNALPYICLPKLWNNKNYLSFDFCEGQCSKWPLFRPLFPLILDFEPKHLKCSLMPHISSS